MFHHVSFLQMCTGEGTQIAYNVSENSVALLLKFGPKFSFCTGIRVAIT